MESGIFNCESGEFVIPSLNARNRMLSLTNIKTGRWKADVENSKSQYWTDICAKITCYHTEVEIDKIDWSKAHDESFFTDRTLAICDIGRYKNKEKLSECENKLIQEKQLSFCKKIVNHHGIDIYESGVICTVKEHSNYHAKIAIKNEKIIAISIECLPNEFVPYNQEIELGNFSCISGKLVISDPCDTLKDNNIVHAKKGIWCAKVEKCEIPYRRDCCTNLWCYHIEYQYFEWEENSNNLVKVNSGQAGIFDAKHYDNNKLAKKYIVEDPICPDELWYSLCCETTSEKSGAGIIPYGAVSCSGLGDGTYQYYTNTLNGETVGIKISFIE